MKILLFVMKMDQHGNAENAEEVENVEHVCIMDKYDMIGLIDDENNEYAADMDGY